MRQNRFFGCFFATLFISGISLAFTFAHDARSPLSHRPSSQEEGSRILLSQQKHPLRSASRSDGELSEEKAVGSEVEVDKIIPKGLLEVTGGSQTSSILNAPSRAEFIKDAKDVAAITFATWITWAANNAGALGPVVASSAVGLIIPHLDKARAVGIFTGSFAGMVSAGNVSGPFVGLLGVLTGLIFREATRRGFAVGVGGRLGFMAQLACSLTLLAQHAAGRGTLSAFFDGAAYAGGWAGLRAALGPPGTAWALLLATPLGAVAAGGLWRSPRMPGVDNPVTASALVGLAGALAGRALAAPLPWAAPAAAALYCGSFVGMSSAARCPTPGALAAAGLLAGLLQVAGAGFLVGGFGGRLGTMAFLATALFQAVRPYWVRRQTEGHIVQQQPRKGGVPAAAGEASSGAAASVAVRLDKPAAKTKAL